MNSRKNILQEFSSLSTEDQQRLLVLTDRFVHALQERAGQWPVGTGQATRRNMRRQLQSEATPGHRRPAVHR